MSAGRDTGRGGHSAPAGARAADARARLAVFYDGACRMCAGVAAWAIARDRHRALDLVPYQSEEARARLGADGAARAAEELHVWSEARGIERGADAVAAMLRRLPGWEWAGRLIGAPPLAWLARPAYRAVARRRRRFGAAACDLPAPGAGSGRGRGRRGARAR